MHINREEEVTWDLVISTNKQKKQTKHIYHKFGLQSILNVHSTFHQERAAEAHVACRLILKNAKSVAMRTFNWSMQFFS